MPIRIVLAEDHYLLREGIAALIATEDVLEFVGTCGDYDSAVAAVDEHLPDVVLTDIRMPPTGTDEGVRLAAWLRTAHPRIVVVVLSQFVEPAYALDLLAGGSAGRAYLLKKRVSEIDDLVGAIRAVADGGSWIDPQVVESLVRANGTQADSPLRHLTVRELEVLAEIATGKNNAAIAEAMYLSGRAVEKAHQLDLLQARAVGGAGRAPPGGRGAAVPRRRGPRVTMTRGSTGVDGCRHHRRPAGGHPFGRPRTVER